VRLPRADTRRDQGLTFEGRWHGGHAPGQLSGAPPRPVPFPEAVPDCDGIPAASTGDVLVAPFNDIETTAALLSRHHQKVAAVIVEPMQRALTPEPGFLEGLRSLTRQYGVVLIFDEIVTGFRLAWGGAQERYGVVPDLPCYGKVIGGGYPVSAVVGRKELMQQADPGQKGRGRYCFLSGTLTGNPVACAAGLATLAVLRQPGAYERLHALGRQLADGLRRVGTAAGVPLQVLGDGPVLQVYFTDHQPLRNHRDLQKAEKNRAVRFGNEMIRRGVYCTPGAKLYLSLAHSDEDTDPTVALAAAALPPDILGQPGRPSAHRP